MRLAVIIPAAGVSRRYHAERRGDAPPTSKIELDLMGRPVFLRAVEVFRGRPQVAQVLLAVHPESIAEFRFKWGDACGFGGVDIIPGGTRERWETVLRALEHVDPDATHVAIHDAARPLTSPDLIDRLLDAAARFDAVVPGVAASNTLKRVATFEEDRDTTPDPLAAILGDATTPTKLVQRVVETVDRSSLVEIQTPQVFALPLLRRAYAQIADGRLDGAGVTDDAMLVEALGEPVRVVAGEPTNFKITRPADLQLAAAWLAATRQPDPVAARRRLFGDDDDA